MRKKVLSLSLSEDLVDLLRSRAEESGVSVSALVEQLLRRCMGEALEEVEERPRAKVPADLEERLSNLEMQIQAIWRRFEQLEEEKMMEHIFEGFEEFLASYEEEK